jgi:two-component system, cell cycle response regulator CpdR
MTATAKSILIVEDDYAALILMRRQLENNGYTVVAADDSTNIIELLSSEHIDLVITDVVMGARGGIHVARDVREARPEIPILFVTGALSPDSGPLLDVARELGVLQILAKPYETKVLLDAVGAAFGSSGNGL